MAWSHAALATEEPPERYRISFRAPAGCPDRSSFLADVGARVPVEWISDEAQWGREMRVELEPRPEGFSARIEYLDAAGQAVSRSLVAPNCAQAAAAIALVTALAIDSQNQELAAPSEQPNAPDPERPKRPADPPAVLAAFPESDQSRTTQAARTLRQEAAVVGGARGGVGPGLAYGATFSWGGGFGAFPLLRVVGSWYETSVPPDPWLGGVTAYFRVLTLGPELCKGDRFGSTAFAGALCLGADVGQYLVEGTSSPQNPMLWIEAYVSAPIRWTSKDVFVELRPDLRFPLARGSFEFVEATGMGPWTGTMNTAQYVVPQLALAANLGVGFTFQ